MTSRRGRLVEEHSFLIDDAMRWIISSCNLQQEILDMLPIYTIPPSLQFKACNLDLFEVNLLLTECGVRGYYPQKITGNGPNEIQR